jgi:high-affinity iron transporter
VGREGLETAVFALAFAFKDGLMLLLGGVFGVIAAVTLCFMIYRLGYRLDFRIFFRTMGILLLFFAAGLLGDAVQNLQELGWISFGTTPVWNTAHILSENSMIGDVLHTIFGYAESPSILQIACYVIFLAVTGTAFWSLTRRHPPAPGVALPSGSGTSAVS